MALDGVSKNTDRETEGREQDQTAHICRLILLYTPNKKCMPVANGRVRDSNESLQVSVLYNFSHYLVISGQHGITGHYFTGQVILMGKLGYQGYLTKVI